MGAAPGGLPIRFLKTIAMSLICIFIMQYLHEFGHALASKALGYDVLLTINKVHSQGIGGEVPLWHSQAIAAAGPAVTIALAAMAFFARGRLPQLALIVILNAAVMRMIAAAVSVSNPNDEAWLSDSLGIGFWTLPVTVCGLLLALFAIAVKEQRPPWTWYAAMWAGISIGYSLVVFGEASFPQMAF